MTTLINVDDDDDDDCGESIRLFYDERRCNQSKEGYDDRCIALKRFSNDCRKTNTKVITPINHNRTDKPIRIPSNYV